MPINSQLYSQPKTRFNLEKHLLLAQFIADKVGLHELSEIKKFNDVNEGFGEDGRSFMAYRLFKEKETLSLKAN